MSSTATAPISAMRSREESTGFLPYGRQTITNEDIEAVVAVLRSDWLTQGPTVPEFEEALARELTARHVVACSSGTAALHLAMLALGIGSGDVVVTSPNTFVADANGARYAGAEVKFADIDPTTGNICPESLAQVFREDKSKKIKAVIPVHFAGQPVDLIEICRLAGKHGAWVVEDACHALGATYDSNGETIPVGAGRHSDLAVFSFHPVKHVAMGEGGAVSTSNSDLARRLATLRSHGIERSKFTHPDMATAADGEVNRWYYEMQELGYNYRLTDIHAALGLSQLGRLQYSVDRRSEIAALYQRLLESSFPDGPVRMLDLKSGRKHAYHLLVVQIDFDRLQVDRHTVMSRLRERGIGTQVNYIPVHLQPYYRERYGHKPGDFPNAERYYAGALSLPMYPALTDADVHRVVYELVAAVSEKRRLQ